MTSPEPLPDGADPVATAAFVARHAGRVVAYLDEVTVPERALRGAGEAFAALRVRLTGARPDEATVARALLDATRAAAGRHAGRGTRGTDAGRERDDAARLLADRCAGRLSPDEDALLGRLLRDAAGARELADDFARAEQGYARERTAPLSGTEVGVIATAMALAGPPGPPAGRGADALTRRTAVPAPPPAGLDPAPAASVHATAPPAASPPSSPPSSPPGTPERQAPTTAAPEDPFGPESLGYAVPHPGLPRAERRPAPPRRRRRRTPGAAPAADGSATSAPARPAGTTPTPAPPAAADPAEGHDRGRAPVPSPADVGTTAEATSDPVRDRASDPAPDEVAPDGERGAQLPALAGATRRVLESPVVRQLGVPALLLLAVLVAALVAAGAFSGRRDESVPSVPRPTIPTVPGDPRAIPPLP